MPPLENCLHQIPLVWCGEITPKIRLSLPIERHLLSWFRAMLWSLCGIFQGDHPTADPSRQPIWLLAFHHKTNRLFDSLLAFASFPSLILIPWLYAFCFNCIGSTASGGVSAKVLAASEVHSPALTDPSRVKATCMKSSEDLYAQV